MMIAMTMVVITSGEAKQATINFESSRVEHNNTNGG
jgi:hypothetical protein